MKSLSFAAAICSIVCLFSVFCSSARAQAYDWRTVKIGGGGFVSGVTFHPGEQGLIYCRTDVGGAYRWDAATSTWIALNDDVGGLNNEFMRLGVASLAIDQADTNRLYLACGQYLASWAPVGVIMRSTDRGANWTISNLSIKLGGNSDGRSTGERLAVDPNLGSVLFLGSNQDGLWKSTDHGATWMRVTTFTPTSCTLVLFDKRSGATGSASQTIYVGVNELTGSNLYRSTDGGATWSAVAGQPTGNIPHHAEIGYDANGQLYVTYGNNLGPNSVTTGAVWKLNTTSGVWTNITPPTGQGGFAGLSVDAQNPQRLVVSTLDRWWPRDVVYLSTNGGTSWTDATTGGTFDNSSAPWASSLTPHWIGDIELDPFNPARAIFITGFGLYSTSTLGAGGTPAWTFFNNGIEETVPRGLASPSSGAPLVSVILDFDGFRHDDLSVSPPAGRHSPRQGSNSALDFAELAPARMVRTYGTSKRGALSTNGGTSWTEFATTPFASAGGGQIAISADGATIVWSQSNSPTYYSTNDGGLWTASSGAPANVSYTFAPVADRVNAAKFYLHESAAGRVYVSTNSGAAFSAAGAVPTGGILYAAPGREGHLWLAAWGSGLRRSTDSGAAFSTVTSVQEAYRLGFGKAALGQTYPAIFIWGKVGGVVGIFRSLDEGASWVRVNDDKHQFGFINAMTGDPRVFGRVYLATSGRGVVYGDVPALVMDTATLPAGEKGVAYSTALAAHGGASPYAWTVSAGALPAGTNLNVAGSLAGTPTAAGVFDFTAQITDVGGGVATRALTLSVAGVSFSRWQQQYFTAGEQADPNVSGSMADPDEDGASNLTEWALARSPKTGETNALITSAASRNPNQFEAIFVRRKAAGGLTYVVEHSLNLTSWTDVGAGGTWTVIDDGNGETETVRVRITQAGAREFLRLRVTGAF